MSKTERILTAVTDTTDDVSIDTLVGVAEGWDDPAVQSAAAEVRRSANALDAALAVATVQRLEAQLAEARTRLPRTPTLKSTTTRRRRRNPSPAEIRAWAVGKGLGVGTRGRISADLRMAYADEVSA